LQIRARKPEELPCPLQQISREEAEGWCEEQLQLLEGQIYDYELVNAAGLLLQESNVIIRNRLIKHVGTLEPGLDTGLLTLTLEDSNGNEVAYGSVEVRSSKLDYRTDYRRMLDKITEKCTDLLMQISEPTQARFAPDAGRSPKTIIQRLAFLQSIIISREFVDARDRILAEPHQRLAPYIMNRDIRQGSVKPNYETLSQLARGQPRTKTPQTHPVSAIMTSLPQLLRVSSLLSTYDTPENRFVKFVLTSFDDFLFQAEMCLVETNVEVSRVRMGIRNSRKFIGDTLSHEFFKDVRELMFLPLDSPVLQRKPGYREILQAWLRFNVAARLIWNGGDDVYGARKRDVARLYEYWVFFMLVDLISELFSISSRSIGQALFERTENGIGLKLKSGSELLIQGISQQNRRALAFRLSYNRTFGMSAFHESTYHKPGSWTVPMRPDSTLSLWPSDFSEEVAEAQETIVHLHFDAKYRVSNSTGSSPAEVTSLFGEEDLEDDDQSNARDSKRADLLRMHAYRDAIRRSEGAYVIYPGTETRIWRSHKEILPSLGAFALSPGREKEGMAELRTFLQQVVEHVSGSTTKREAC
jgi:predicted component of viral defense system (DUF524 family)